MNEQENDARLVIRIRGIPPKATLEDVLAFLSGLDVNEESVNLSIRDRKVAGEVCFEHMSHRDANLFPAYPFLTYLRSFMQAIVVLNSPEDVRRACGKDGSIFSPKFGSRFVRVTVAKGRSSHDDGATKGRSSHDDGAHPQPALTNTSLHQGPPPTTTTTRTSSGATPGSIAIKVEGLPANISVQEVVQLFWGSRASVPGTVVRREIGKPHAEALLDMGSAEDAAFAAVAWNGTVMTTQAGAFTLSVQPVTYAEWNAAMAAAPASALDRSTSHDSATVIKIRNLPLGAGSGDLAHFFDGYQMKPNGVKLSARSENGHSRVGYIEFESADEAARAMKDKDRQILGCAFGDTSCILQRVSKLEMMADMARMTTSTTTNRDLSATANPPRRGSSIDYSSLAASRQYNSMARGTSGMPLPAGSFFGMPPPPFMMAPPQMAGTPTWGALPYPGGIGMGMGMPMQAPWAFAFPTPTATPGAAASPPPTAGMAPWPPAVPPPLPTPSHPTHAGFNPSMMFPRHEHQSQTFEAQPAPMVTGAARYMVQDLSTGEKVFLDPRFNIYKGPDVKDAADEGSGDGNNNGQGNQRWAAAGRSVAANEEAAESVETAASDTEEEEEDGSGGSEPTQETVMVPQDQGSNEGSDDGRSSPSHPPAAKKCARGNSHPVPGTAIGFDKKIRSTTATTSGGGESSRRNSKENAPHKRHLVDVTFPLEDERPVKHSA